MVYTNPELLRAAVASWRMTHEVLHGPLDKPTLETIEELVQFLTDCARAERHFQSATPLNTAE